MSGRSYTMKEMRTIVEYVNTRKAYGEIRGRKLWTEFASSNLTNRTWQSLKETFLKRILPDIHNPYYGLTTSEICSFKQGYDVDTRSKNKLNIHTIGDDSNHSHAGNVQDNEKPSTSNKNVADNSTGEKISPSTLDARTRASTETIVLDNCYENADEIMRDLESPEMKPMDTRMQDDKDTPNKCLRDLITYAEPLTPMMQQVLDDFATEDELVEAELEILESTNNRDEESCNKTKLKTEDSNQINKKEDEKSNDKQDNSLSDVVQCTDSIKIPLGQEPKVSENNNTKNSSDLIENSNDKGINKQADVISYNLDKREKNKDFVDLTNDTGATQNTNNSTDTTIPGNQEALNNTKEKTEQYKNTEVSTTANKTRDACKKLTLSRKRSHSLDTIANIDKKNMFVSKNISVTQSEIEDKSGKLNKEIVPERNKGSDENNKTANNFQNVENNEVPKSVEQNNSQINPCLNSVSLYDEQFNNTKYTDSESSDNSTVNAIVQVHREKDEEQNHKEKEEDRNEENVKENSRENDTASNKKLPEVLKKAEDINEVVILKSHSESDDSNEAVNQDNQEREKQVDKRQREKALANMFGFSSGVVSSSRKRKLSRHYRSTSDKHNASNSSEWTSESDSDFVSPPRGRRNSYARKYLKPKSARILQLDEEGGMFVMHGKRIYPIVKDGSVIKNYLTYTPESDPEDDPAYWKKKYEEERKKTEELKKMVEESKVKLPVRDQSPNLPTTSSNTTLPQSPPKLIPIPEGPKVEVPPKMPRQDVKSYEKTLKIKFTKNNEELQLEGSWSQIHPALADVVQLFNKDSEPNKEVQSTNIYGMPDADEVFSLRSSLFDEEAVRQKVEKMEEEIFKEIEELDKSEREQEAGPKEQEANVNKRRRIVRPRKSSTAFKSADSSSSPSITRSTKASKDSVEQVVEKENDQPEIGRENGLQEVENVNGQQAVEKVNGQQAVEKENNLKVVKELPKRRIKSPRKFKEYSPASNEKSKKLPKSPRKSSNLEPESTQPSPTDSEIRYMFPPAKNTRKSTSKTVKTNARSSKIPTNPTSENLSLNSIESSQGYQDSDPSPAKERIMLKRKRKLSLSSILYKGKQRRFVRRRSYPCVSDDASSESSNLSFKVPMKNTSASSKSDVYQSESYQLLMPVKKRSYTALEKIDELSPIYNHDMNDKDSLKIPVEALDLKIHESSGIIRSDGNSSNISLPQSPELSIVENISVSKEILDSIEDFPTLNEMQANNEPISEIHNKYLMSAVDITMPLMEQDCDIQKSITPDRLDYQNNATTSESLLNRIDSVNITEGPTISDSLDSRLRNLLLESAKKMEVDTLATISEERENVVRNSAVMDKKSRAKKRCSTPHKRNSKKKSKILDIDPVVEEEQMEFCSYGGRKSCPPVIQVLPNDSCNENEHFVINNTESAPLKKSKKKKDIIKVKILKPKPIKRKRVSLPKVIPKISHDVTAISFHTDSGINETGSAFLQDSDDSVDLIHNHSETCLQTKECLGDSIEFVDRDTSVITIDSQDSIVFKDAENIPPELFCKNAHHGTNVTTAKTMNSQCTGDTVYLSPVASELSANSLITEDLSDENANEKPNLRQSQKWYLFSDDETTNTNHAPSFGANLMQIFPLICAVPNLSTVTEMSKDNDSRQPTLDTDGDTRNDLDSQSMF